MAGGGEAAAPRARKKRKTAPSAPSAGSAAAPTAARKRKSARGKTQPSAKHAKAGSGAAERAEQQAAAKAAAKTAKALLKAASAEQSQLQKADEKARKKAAKAAAKAAAAQELRQPPSLKGETATDPLVHQLLKGVAEDFCIKEPVAPERAARRALLGPMLAEEPSPAVLAFCRKWRELAHAAYAKAASLPAAQHAEANLALRLGVVGPEVRGALSAAWLAVPEVGVVARSKARLVLFWNDALQEFKRLNAPVETEPEAPAGEVEHAASDAERDRRVVLVIGGWVAFSLIGRCKKGSAAAQALLPLLKALVIPEGTDGLSLRDPATLFMLARQQFGGLTALTPGAATWLGLELTPTLTLTLTLTLALTLILTLTQVPCTRSTSRSSS